MKLNERIQQIEHNQSTMMQQLQQLVSAIQSLPGTITTGSIKTDLRSIPKEDQRQVFRKMIEKKWQRKYGLLN